MTGLGIQLIPTTHGHDLESWGSQKIFFGLFWKSQSAFELIRAKFNRAESMTNAAQMEEKLKKQGRGGDRRSLRALTDTSSQVLRGGVSYATIARLNERRLLSQKMEKMLTACDPLGLLPRPRSLPDCERMLERFIAVERSTPLNLQHIKRRIQALRLIAGRRPKTRAERLIAFIENYLLVPEGPKTGQQITLEPFQAKFMQDVFDNPNGTNKAILSEAKKNGKTATIATIASGFLTGPETRPNAQIVSGAMEREQAAIVFNYAEKMMSQSVWLHTWLDFVPSRKRIFGTIANTEYRALAAAAKSTQGISPLIAIVDELGQVRGPNSEFFDAIVTAQGAYADAILFIISTQAADDADLFSIEIDDALASADPHIVCHLYEADANCLLLDEAQWLKANPALGTFRTIEDMRKLAEKAKRMPSFTNAFRNLNLNQRVERNAPFVSKDVWDENATEPDHIDGQLVFGGLDLAEVNDLCSAVFLSDAGDVYCFNWLPTEGLQEKIHRDKAPYDLWAKDEYIFLTEGRTVSWAAVADFLFMLKDRCKFGKIGFDRYGFNQFRPSLLSAGFTNKEIETLFVPFGQGYVSMSPALRQFEECLLAKRLRHGNNPVLRWAARNVKVERDPAGNRKFNKARSSGRIDPMVSLAMAIGVMPIQANDTVKTYQLFMV